MRISVFDSKELQATLLALRSLDRDTRKEIRTRTRALAGPEFSKAVAENVSTRQEARILGQSARVQVSDQNVTLRAAHIGRPLSGGLSGAQWYALEFGANRDKTSTYTATSRRGNRYTVTRHTARQLRPRNRQGYALTPTAKNIVPRLASLWIQTTVRTFLDALERS